VSFGEALRPEFKEYAQQVVANAQALANGLLKRGFNIVSGGTDNHLMLVDLRSKNITGKKAEKYLDEVGVTCNKWSEVFGYYDVDKVSQNIGSNQNYQWGYGFGSQYSINVSSNREFIVKPEELARMAINEVYVLDRNARELAYTTIR